MLPGLAGVGGFIGIPDPFIGSTEATTAGPTTTLTINKPAGVETGHILVALLGSNTASGVSWTGDAGWTEIYDQDNGSRPSLRVAYLVAGGSEPASYTFTSSASTGLFGQILCFRGYGYDTIGSAVPLVGNGSLVITGLTSAAGVLIGAAASAGGSSTPTHSTPTDMTLIRATTLSTSMALTSWYQMVGAGATGTRTTTVAGAPTSNGILVGLK